MKNAQTEEKGKWIKRIEEEQKEAEKKKKGCKRKR